MYNVVWTKQARKDHKLIAGGALAVNLAEILNTVRENPFEKTPGHNFEQLKGYNPPTYTRRLDRYNRFVYTMAPNAKGEKDRDGTLYDGVVVIHRLWGHFPP